MSAILHLEIRVNCTLQGVSCTKYSKYFQLEHKIHQWDSSFIEARLKKPLYLFDFTCYTFLFYSFLYDFIHNVARRLFWRYNLLQISRKLCCEYAWPAWTLLPNSLAHFTLWHLCLLFGQSAEEESVCLTNCTHSIKLSRGINANDMMMMLMMMMPHSITHTYLDWSALMTPEIAGNIFWKSERASNVTPKWKAFQIEIGSQ